MTHFVCPHCVAVNNVPANRDPQIAKCGRCHQPLFSGKPVDVNAAAFEQHITRNDVPVVVDFWAAWCGPCRMMAPIFTQAAAELEPRVRFLKVDTEAEQDLAQRLAIRSIPTLMMFYDGKEQARQAGVLDRRALLAWIDRHSAR